MIKFQLLVFKNGFHTEENIWSTSMRDGLMKDLDQCKWHISTVLDMNLGRTSGASGMASLLELVKLLEDCHQTGDS
jgi:hypothetical protein